MARVLPKSEKRRSAICRSCSSSTCFPWAKAFSTDLEYGSDFLWRLNDEWLTAWNDAKYPLYRQMLAFSLGGDFIGNDKAMNLFWATCESGSDNTVRISGANLNYTFLEANPDVDPPLVTPRVLSRRVPHLILHGYSHFDSDTGILHATDAADPAFTALLTALQTSDAQLRRTCATVDGSERAWATGQPEDANSTVVFGLKRSGGPSDRRLHDRILGRARDSKATRTDITLPPSRPSSGDYVPPPAETPAEAAMRQQVIDASLNSSDAILGNSPIHNDVAVGSYSFYLNYPKWCRSRRPTPSRDLYRSRER